MKKVFSVIASVIIGISSMVAQQLPNPSFEDWSGATFDGNIQPASWYASNVVQFGFKFNFAHREAGHTGSYSMRVSDQEVGAAGITEVSPGYFTLGQPWVYVASLTAVSGATAGTHGGIDWTYRPDSMSVWIKRTGPHTDKEKFYLVYYAWKGQSRGDRFKGKNGTCTTVTHYDEESDIRQSIDGNKCGTAVMAQQIAEGQWCEYKTYSDWTEIHVPIYYMSDEVPEKMNIIFSASRYPDQRANTGLYNGNNLFVDDVSLIYSDKIQKLYIDDFEWKGFDPNSDEEQIYSLGEKATSIPTNIKAYRGAGTLKNNDDKVVSFQGRQLQSSEMTVTPGVLDGAPTQITVRSGDGQTTRTYKIKFVRAASTNAKLASIRVNGVALSNFNPALMSYNVSLPYGTTAVPVVEADAQDAGAVVTITQSSSTTGQAVITVVAADGIATMTYVLNFSVAALSDNTLQDIKVNGESVAGFSPSNTIYRVSLPLGTTEMPTVEAVSAYPAGEQTIEYTAPTVLDGGQYKISVTTPGNPVAKVYKLNLKLEASSYAYLRGLEMAGGYIPNFDPQQLTYYVNLPLGTTSLPEITYTTGDAYQTVSVESAGLDGTTRVVVVAGDGVTQVVYKIVVATEKSTRSDLKMIYLDGDSLAGFASDVLNYDVELPIGTTEVPAITVDKGDEFETVRVLSGGTNGTTRITVTAGDGTSTIYQIAFSVKTSSDATLSMIYLDGTPLVGYDPAVLEYTISLPQGTTALPAVTYDVHDALQKVTVRAPQGVNGDYKLTVRPQTGSSQTYVLHFVVTVSGNSHLSGINVGGEALADFDPETLNYSITLPEGVSTIPAVTYTKGDNEQRVLQVQNGQTVTLTVTAGDGTKTVYTLDFVIQKSANALLKMIYLDGDSLEGFDPQVLAYTDSLDEGATCPAITVESESGQQVIIVAPYSSGLAQIVVTPESGASNTYTITFASRGGGVKPGPEPGPQPEPSSNCLLSSISLNGEALADFDPNTLSYTRVLVQGSAYPTIGYTKADSTATTTFGATAKGQYAISVIAQNGDVRTYTVAFTILPYDNVQPIDISLEGMTLGYDPEVVNYTLVLDKGAVLPSVSVIAAQGQDIAIEERDADTQVILVTAESGRQQTYTIHYERVRSQNALLDDILVGGVSLDGFDPSVFEYTYGPLAKNAKVIPSVHPVGQLINQTIVTEYCRPGGVVKIHVLAEDSTTSSEYQIAFPILLSGNTALRTLDIDYSGLEFAFDSTTLNYDIELGYTDTIVPSFAWEAADASARVEMESRPLGDTTLLTVTAPNGDSRVYRLYFHRKAYTAANRLKQLRIAETGEVLDVTTLAHTVTLPYGTRTLTVEYEKEYAAQTVFVVNGGVYRPTTVTVRANRAGEEDKVYTITPDLQTVRPAVLTDLRVNGEQVEGFNPEQQYYIVRRQSAGAMPNVTYTAATGATVSGVTMTSRQWTAQVTSGEMTTDYTIFFHYVNDTIPNGEMTQWTSAARRTSAKKPTYWHVAADYADTYLGTVRTGTEVSQSGDKAKMTTTYWAALASGIPSVMTLGDLTFSFGVAGSTSSKFSGGIAFRNTPDSCRIGYYYKAKAGNGARFALRFYDENNTEYNMDYLTTTTTSDYVEHVQPLATDGKNINRMNIAVNATSEERATSSGVELYVDYFRYVYNSRLAGIRVNGVDAERTGDTFTATLTDTLLAGLPTCLYVGEVSDQAQAVNWGNEVLEGNYMVRSASVRNYAEDGTYTDYALKVRRVAEIRNQLSALYVDGSLIEGFSPEQTDYTIQLSAIEGRYPDIVPEVESPLMAVAMAWEDSVLTISVTPEKGETTEYRVRFVTTLRHSTELAQVTAEGLTFSPATRTYTLAAETYPAITYAKSYDAQTVVQKGGLLEVTAEDGTKGQYTITLVRPTTKGQLSELELNGSLMSSFSATTYDYDVERPNRTAFVRVADIDSVVFTQQEYSMSWDVYGTETHTYTLHFPTDVSSDARLNGILVDGDTLADFDAQVYAYTVVADSNVEIRPLSKDGQTVTVSRTDDTYTISVVAEDGVTTLSYSLTIAPSRSNEALLASISLDGELIEGFDPATLNYTVVLPVGEYKTAQPQMPALDYTVVHARTTVEVQPALLGQPIYLDVTAEDGISHAQYQVLVEAEKSHYTRLNGILVNGELLPHFETGRHYYAADVEGGDNQITWTSYDAFQTVRVDTMDTEKGQLYVLTVQAEDGVSTEVYEVELFVRRLSSDAMLANILLDGAEMSEFYPDFNHGVHFDPNNNTYQLGMPSWVTTLPNVSAVQRSEGQTVSISRTDRTISLQVTARDGVTRNTYTLTFLIPQSSNTMLSMIYLNGDSLKAFDPTVHFYMDTLAVGVMTLPEVVGQKAEPVQTIGETLVSGQRVTIPVTAEDGTTGEYTIFFTYRQSEADSLMMIYEDGVAIEGFRPAVHYYHRMLPVGTTAFPEISWLEADRWQTISLDTTRQEAYSQTMLVNVESMSGRRSYYTLEYDIALSTVDTLQMIYVDNQELTDFNARQDEYSYVLPAGTTEIPSLFYVCGDAYQTVQVLELGDSLATGKQAKKAVFVVTAQQGNSRTYTIHFPIAPSSDALLNGIYYGGQIISGFDSETMEYTQRLEKGVSTVPVITVATRNDAQQVTINYVSDMIVTITVTAEDGVTTAVYTLHFVNADDDCNTLAGIAVDATPLTNFDPMINDYEIELPYGTTALPEVTYTMGAKGQTVTSEVSPLTDGRGSVTLVVLPPNGDSGSENEYTLRFTTALNDDASLAKIWVRGEMLDGFERSITDYEVIYADTCTEEDFFGLDEMEATPTDPLATVSYLQSDNAEQHSRTIIITVTAQNGEVMVYTIEQRRLRSSNSNLEAIYLNDELVEDFAPNQYIYRHWMRRGVTTLPEIDAVPEDDRADVSVLTMEISGDTIPVLIICKAEDGSDSRYMIYFITTPIDDSKEPHAEDVIVKVVDDGKLLVTTLRRNVAFALFDLAGREVVFLPNIESPDPNNAVTQVNANGTTVLIDVKNLDGSFANIRANQIYVYCFFESGKYKICSGKMYIR